MQINFLGRYHANVMKDNFLNIVALNNVYVTVLQTVGPNSVHSGNGRPILALRYLISLPVSTPLRIVNRCWSLGVSGGI